MPKNERPSPLAGVRVVPDYAAIIGERAVPKRRGPRPYAILPPRQSEVLRAVIGAGLGITGPGVRPKELATVMWQVPSTSIHACLRILEQKGYIECEHRIQDPRHVLTYNVTARGIAVYKLWYRADQEEKREKEIRRLADKISWSVEHEPRQSQATSPIRPLDYARVLLAPAEPDVALEPAD